MRRIVSLLQTPVFYGVCVCVRQFVRVCICVSVRVCACDAVLYNVLTSFDWKNNLVSIPTNKLRDYVYFNTSQMSDVDQMSIRCLADIFSRSFFELHSPFCHRTIINFTFQAHVLSIIPGRTYDRSIFITLCHLMPQLIPTHNNYCKVFAVLPSL